MKTERSNVEFPLWRKKVDKSLFEHNGTTIPTWACQMWGLDTLYADVSSKKDARATVTVYFERRKYQGWVTCARHGRKTPAYRLWFEEDLTIQLKNKFLMSYMRSLEQGLQEESQQDIENDIPFWEFLDIEFDKTKKVFRFVAYYTQSASFPNLFARLIGSPSLHRVSDEIEGKKEKRIYKQDWKPREELPYELGATNAIYTLMDTVNKLIYVGEAQDLVKRLSQRYPSIPHWDYFRYDVLPTDLVQYRVPLERMMIRYLAAILPNKKNIPHMAISEYRLTNDKVDK